MATHISKAQIAKIWACAHAIGLDREMLYLLVPRGSISAMTREEASELIEHLLALEGRRVGPLEKEPSAPAGPDAATPEQRHFIYFLLGRLGWLHEPRRVRGFLKKFARAESVEAIPDRRTASNVIEALKAIWKRNANARK